MTYHFVQNLVVQNWLPVPMRKWRDMGSLETNTRKSRNQPQSRIFERKTVELTPSDYTYEWITTEIKESSERAE